MNVAADAGLMTCPDCNAKLNSKQQWELHLQGSKHLRAIAIKEAEDIADHMRTPSPAMSSAISNLLHHIKVLSYSICI